jgi:hypothetical protein
MASPSRQKPFRAAVILSLLTVLTLAGLASGSDRRSHESKNLRLVGVEPLQGRSAYQPWVEQQGRRWILYVGHHGGAAFNPQTATMENNGTSIVDVTDPQRPRYLVHVPGPSGVGEAGGAQMVRVCKGQHLPRANRDKVYMLRATPSAHEIYDVTVPENPVLVTTVVSGLRDTHKNWWECHTGIGLLVSGVPDWRTTRHLQVFDLSDPLNPVFIRNFGLVGQEPGSTGPVPTSLHGPISLGDRVYMAHGTNANGILQILDRKKLLEGDPAVPAATRFDPTPANLLYPQLGILYMSPTNGVHTGFPIHGMAVPDFAENRLGKVRDIVVISNEAIGNECRENRQMVYIADVTTPDRSQVVANYQVPESSGDFCPPNEATPPSQKRGGRFGTHSSHENMNAPFHAKLMVFAWFNAGVRVADIRDPWTAKEVAFFIPRTNANADVRCSAPDVAPNCPRPIQTNNVEADDRGLIYAVDRANNGLHILQLTGKAAKIGGLPGGSDHDDD